MLWSKTIGFGVAGNFTGHLEQAGEASDFLNVKVSEAAAPKGIFPFYIPHDGEPGKESHFLNCMPVSSDKIILGSLEENHQIEPELSLSCEIVYENERVTDIIPKLAMAHNDCSIRRAGAKKISEKKNWGPASKGTSSQSIAIDKFAEGGVLDRCRLASFLWREGTLYPYGLDSEITGYSYFYQTLVDWLVVRMNTQRDEGPLEDIPRWISRAGYPKEALVSVGATRYTEFGETHFLRPGDHSVVVLYDGEKWASDDISRIALDPKYTEYQGLSVLNQRVEAPSVK